MGKLRKLSAKEIAAILEAHGFERRRQKGSHIAFRHAEPPARTVIVPDRKAIPIGTLASIIRQSGLDRSLFEEQG